MKNLCLYCERVRTVHVSGVNICLTWMIITLRLIQSLIIDNTHTILTYILHTHKTGPLTHYIYNIYVLPYVRMKKLWCCPHFAFHDYFKQHWWPTNCLVILHCLLCVLIIIAQCESTVLGHQNNFISMWANWLHIYRSLLNIDKTVCNCSMVISTGKYIYISQWLCA